MTPDKPRWQQVHEGLFPVAVWLAVLILASRFLYLQVVQSSQEGFIFDGIQDIRP